MESDERPLTPEDWVFSALLDMVWQHCGSALDDKLDSYAISANATAMRLLADAGLIQIESEFSRRVFANVLPAAHELAARIEAANRKERIREARERLGTIPDLTPEKMAKLYDITLAELIPEVTAPC